ncbi:hypothetical protein J2X68_006581 [Streptomyces sp. 3330]|nr:hypothetical protein [Streptomyces sp. 3330]
MTNWTAADEAEIAYGLSGWHPTPGTRTAGAVSRERRGGRRARYTGGRLEYHDDRPTLLQWAFPDPMGTRELVGEFTMADVVTVPSHLSVPRRTHPHDDRGGHGPRRPGHAGADRGRRGRERGRAVRPDLRRRRRRARRPTERRLVASGRDIYAVGAPLAVEAVHRVLTGRTRTVGVASAGGMSDAPDFLRALSPHLSVEPLQQGQRRRPAS